MAGEPPSQMDAISTIIYTYRTMAWGVTSATRRVRMDANDRYISYLPLAHVAERMLIEQASLRLRTCSPATPTSRHVR
jgi:long-chain acyl-CoA synthetase